MTVQFFVYNARFAKAVAGNTFGPGQDPILDNVECFGNESDINDCPQNSWQEKSCDHYHVVGVVCSK